jgi:D-glycero-D-manno-heptose 1,7-bisphosphate phosphatase
VVVLDRDGTLVVDRHYLCDPAGLEFLPGAAAALRHLSQFGYRIVVITNQSGIGRGLITPAQLQAMNQRLQDMVKAAGAQLAGIYCCPHAPDAGCQCRKPAQGLMLQAAAELQFEPARAVVVGDQDSDVEFGRRAGSFTIRVSSDGPDAGSTPADAVVADLAAAAEIIFAREVKNHAPNFGAESV